MQNLIECPGVLQFRQMLAHGGNEAGKATTVGMMVRSAYWTQETKGSHGWAISWGM